jgi:formylglycine-generating enzyme required for sulfatase activity
MQDRDECELIEMIFVKGGTFNMPRTWFPGYTYNIPGCCLASDEAHQETVCDFYIGKYRITQAQWRAVMGTTVRQQRDKISTDYPVFSEGDNEPMYYINWHNAHQFISKLNTRTGKQYRLPTEAEWEFIRSTKSPEESGLIDFNGFIVEWCTHRSGFGVVPRCDMWNYNEDSGHISWASVDFNHWRGHDFPIGLRLACSADRRTDKIHFYRWGDAPVIWDDERASAFVYRNGEWICISMHTFYDHADEIVDDKEFQHFFSEHILKEYERYIADRYKFDAKSTK